MLEFAGRYEDIRKVVAHHHAGVPVLVPLESIPVLRDA